jgi:hypothetical protein
MQMTTRSDMTSARVVQRLRRSGTAKRDADGPEPSRFEACAMSRNQTT